MPVFALAAKKSNEKSGFAPDIEMTGNIAASRMRLDQAKSCLETAPSGF
jgi:hypothetical protein